MFNFTRAQISQLFTTSNALGSFEGNQIPNLQINNLEPGEYTLQFQQVESTIDGSGQATYAIVRWKIQGQQIQRIISVFSGAVLTGVAEAVDVQLLDQSERGFAASIPSFATVTNGSPIVPLTLPIVLGADEQVTFFTQPAVSYALAGPVNGSSIVLATPYTGPNGALVRFFATASYKVAVSLSRGTRPTIMQPPILLTTKPISVSASSISAPPIFIPIDAGVISAFVTVDVVGSAGTAQAEAANARVIFADIRANPLTRFIPQPTPGWYAIPPGTDHIVFVNDSTTAAINFSIQWGIEG